MVCELVQAQNSSQLPVWVLSSHQFRIQGGYWGDDGGYQFRVAFIQSPTGLPDPTWGTVLQSRLSGPGSLPTTPFYLDTSLLEHCLLPDVSSSPPPTSAASREECHSLTHCRWGWAGNDPGYCIMFHLQDSQSHTPLVDFLCSSYALSLELSPLMPSLYILASLNAKARRV